jgi:hypothetical protein
VIEVAEGMDERVCRTNPIRCRVSGGYTISKQTGYGADSSPETLLTCILQVGLLLLLLLQQGPGMQLALQQRHGIECSDY